MGKSVKEGIMPKEFIQGRWFGQTARSHSSCDTQGEPHCPPDCGGTLTPLDDSAIKVGWEKGTGHVELAVVVSDDGVFVEHGYLTGHLDGSPRTVEEQIADAESTPRYIQLDRGGINRLITALRQARDDAFGKDA